MKPGNGGGNPIRNPIVPALISVPILALAVTMGFPLVYTVILSFGNMNLFHFRNPDFSLSLFLENMKGVFTGPILRRDGLWIILGRTLLWTGIQTFFQVLLGLILALALNAPIRFTRIFKWILVLPWAIPGTISLMTLRYEFHPSFGFINQVIELLPGVVTGPAWWSDPFWNFVSMNLVNLWLGVPFMMILLLGALQGVDRNCLEAAELDGASRMRRLLSVTLPLILPTVLPAVLFSAIYSFNNFGVPYFMNPQELENSHLLSLAIFRAASYFNRYSFSSALAIVNTLIVLLMVMIPIRYSGLLKEAKR